MRPSLGLRSGSRHAQCSPSAQTVHQLAPESTSSLNVEGLIDSFVRDAHGLIIREIDRKSVGNLFGRPAIDPFAVTATWFIPTLEWRLPRACNLTTLSVMNLPC